MMTAPVSCLERPRLVMNRAYADLLERSGMSDFEAVYGFDGGETVKNIPARWVTRIALMDGERERVFFLKRHRPERPHTLRRMIARCTGGAVSEGLGEFRTLCAFRENELPTVTPVVAGECHDPDGRVRSFVMTEDFHPLRQLEALIRRQPDIFAGEAGRRFKSVLMGCIGWLARRMHDSGFNHKDFNATHILVDTSGYPEAVQLALFDLQRVAKRKVGRFRWIIKALAELNYTLPDALFGEEDREALFSAYKGKSSPGFRGRIQRIWIRKKVARIGRHTLKRRRRVRR